MELISDYFRLLGASQALLFLILFISSKNPKFVRWIGTFLIVGIIGYLLHTIVEDKLAWKLMMPVWFFTELIPAFLALFVWVLFEEERAIPRALFATLWVNVAVVLFMQFQAIADIEYGAALLIAYFFKVAWVIAAIVILYMGRDMDLVEGRQKLRLVFVSLIAVIVLLVVVSEMLFGMDVPHWFEVPGMFLIFVSSLAVNIAFAKTNPQMDLVGIVAPEPLQTEDPVIIELLARMRDERLYADHDLRVSTLAASLRVPEYQLRKKINQSLGYRNFNQFINKYRIEEAGQRLIQERKTPVLSIALDVGFRSISSFNSAFAAQYGLSPTKYRRQKLPDS